MREFNGQFGSPSFGELLRAASVFVFIAGPSYQEEDEPSSFALHRLFPSFSGRDPLRVEETRRSRLAIRGSSAETGASHAHFSTGLNVRF